MMYRYSIFCLLMAAVIAIGFGCTGVSARSAAEKYEEEFPSWQFLQQHYTGHFFYRGETVEKQIALTFDDGPSPLSESILDLLDRHDVKASFFWQGVHVTDHSDTINRGLITGHTIANHSWDHPNHADFSPERLWREQVLPTTESFRKVIDRPPLFYRPPFGAISRSQIDYLSERGLKVVGWSITSRDWDTNHNQADQMVDHVLSELHPGAIILFHDAFVGVNDEDLLMALESIIIGAREVGYSWVTLDILLN